MYGIIQSEEQGLTVFGIEGHGERIERISTDRSAVEAFIAQCNRGDIAPWQLQDAVEDFVQKEAMLEEAAG